MRRHFAIATLLLLFLSLIPRNAQADPPFPRCAPYAGTFRITATGLVVAITHKDGKPMTSHTERVANPPADANDVVKRGALQFEAHVDPDSGGLFVHWDSLQPAK